ncbi:MAG: LysR family transcriptional regulator [Kordiimonas sp.]
MNNWDDLRYFLEVARAGNVTSAAKILGVNHSTVSRRIHAFEEKHGVRLFDRVPSGYELTEPATCIYQMALEVEATHQKISRSLFGRDGRIQGDISLTMPHDILEHCLIEDLRTFRDEYPEIDLNLFIAKGIKNLAAREADLAVRLSPAPPDHLIGTRVATLQHGIYANTEIDTSNNPDLIVWNSETELPDWAKEHFPNSKIAMRVDDLYGMFAAVKAGIGIARMPCYLPDALAAPTVKRMPIAQTRSAWGVWVLNHADLRYTARIQLCRKFLIKHLKERRGLFEGEQSVFFQKNN